MSRLTWPAGEPPQPGRTVPVDRFTNRHKRSVWVLGDVVQRLTHFKLGERSKPCVWPDPCPLCEDPLWKKQKEGYFPCATKESFKDGAGVLKFKWVPAVGVLTAGAMKSFEAGPHRGLRLSIFRHVQGTANVMKIEVEAERSEPELSTFDVRPHVEHLWHPAEQAPDTSDVPEPVPVQPIRMLQPTPMSAEDRAQARKLLEASGLANRDKRDLRPDLPGDREKTLPTPISASGANTSPLPGGPAALQTPDSGARSPSEVPSATKIAMLPDPMYSGMSDGELAGFARACEMTHLLRPQLADAKRELDRRRRAAEKPADNSVSPADMPLSPSRPDLDALLDQISCSVDDIETLGTGAIITRGVRDRLPAGHPSARKPSSNGHAHANGQPSKAGGQ